MSADVLMFQKPKPRREGSPRVIINSMSTGDGGEMLHDVELVWHEGQGGFEVVATFSHLEDAEHCAATCRYAGGRL